MKSIFFTIIAGIILLYFLNIAIIKTNLFDPYWVMHDALRFVVAFFILGISYFYLKAHTFKRALYVTIIIVAADYIYDDYWISHHFKFEAIFYGIYMVIWGAILGYLTAKYIKDKITHD